MTFDINNLTSIFLTLVTSLLWWVDFQMLTAQADSLKKKERKERKGEINNNLKWKMHSCYLRSLIRALKTTQQHLQHYIVFPPPFSTRLGFRIIIINQACSVLRLQCNVSIWLPILFSGNVSDAMFYLGSFWLVWSSGFPLSLLHNNWMSYIMT